MPRAKQPSTDTKFMSTLKEKLVGKDLADGTVSMYITKLKKLNDNKPFSSLSFLKDTRIIKAFLDKIENINTKKSYMTAMVSVLNNTDSKQYNTANTYYKALLNDSKVDVDVEMNQKQKDNWMTWNEVLAVYKKIDDIAKLITEEDMQTSQAKKDLTDHLLLSFYVLIPPRRNDDYFLMKLDKNKNVNETSNYYRPETSKFIFNKYKTKKHYGAEEINVNTKLKSVLDNYIKLMKLNDDDYLLFNDNRQKSNVMTKALNRIFGKNIGASMLRHIYLTSKYGAVKEEMAKDAEAMAHSVGEQQDYIKK